MISIDAYRARIGIFGHSIKNKSMVVKNMKPDANMKLMGLKTLVMVCFMFAMFSAIIISIENGASGIKTIEINDKLFP